MNTRLDDTRLDKFFGVRGGQDLAAWPELAAAARRRPDLYGSQNTAYRTYREVFAALEAEPATPEVTAELLEIFSYETTDD